VNISQKPLPNSGIRKSKYYDCNVTTDRQRVMQVLLSLQSNALKFTQSGAITVRVEIIEDFEPDDLGNMTLSNYLQVSIIDTGVGIPYDD